MPAKKTASKKRKKAAPSKKKASAKKTASGKKVAKKRKVTKKKTTTSSRRKTAKKKVAKKKTVSRKKAAKKKVAKKKAGKKKTSKKKVARKKASKKKVSKKKPSKKKSSKKKVAGKKAAKKKAVGKSSTKKKAASRKKSSKKSAAGRSTGTKKVTPRRAAPVRKAPPRGRRSRASLLSGPIHGVEPYKPKRGEEYMSAEQLDHFREILTAWKRELMFEVDRTVHHMQDEAANFPDPNDRATQESEFGLELRTRDRERKLLRKIDSALARIDDGSYGFCDETGEEIGLKRLEARPVATLCLEAQERRELAERQFRDRDDRYR